MQRKVILFCAGWVFAFFFQTSFSHAAGAAADSPIRVLVAENQKSIVLSAHGDYQIAVLPSLKVVKKGTQLKNVSVSSKPGTIRLGNEEWPASGLRIQVSEDNSLFIHKSRFRGSLDILKNSQQSTFYVINRLPIESYLYGVLHHEVSPWWPMEALKAQAIAARTYAYYQAQVSRAAEYDVKSSTSSQVYGGSTTERFRTKRAVDLTNGKILTYQSKVFPAYFHATCAGLTAAADELWKIRLKPLSGGAKCDSCRISPHYRWQIRLPLAEIEEKMVKYGRPVGRILKLEVITQTPSHRVGSLKITGVDGEAVVAAKDFRVWIGGDRMRSTNLTVTIRDDFAKFEGKGWGHGVGLCQWGTLGQALVGRKSTEILQFYYPEASIIDL